MHNLSSPLRTSIFACLMLSTPLSYSFEYVAAAAVGTAIGGYTGYVRVQRTPNPHDLLSFQDYNALMRDCSIMDNSLKGMAVGLLAFLTYRLTMGGPSTISEGNYE